MTRSRPVKTRRLMRPYALVYLYRARLRIHGPQELLAAIGVAAAVALLFATLVASGSIASSADDVVHAVVGPATLQLRARDGDGFDEHLLRRVKHLSGVKQAAPLLEQTATIAGPRARRVTVDVAGTTVGLAILNGLAHTLPISALAPGGVGLSTTAAEALGIARTTGGMPTVSLKLRGTNNALKVSAVLGAETFGALSRARVAVMPLSQLQQLARLSGRISRILIETQPGRQAAVRSEVERLVGRRLIVAPAKQDEQLLRATLRPSSQASAVFAAISALLGFLFAFNAILLTVPERRRMIASLRVDGTRRSAIVQMIVFQAVWLGAVASAVGVLIGYVLSRGVFRQSPGYLSQAFTLGSGTVVGVEPFVLALAGGVLATVLASTLPLLDLRAGRAMNAIYHEEGVPGNILAEGVQRWLFGVALGLLALASALFWLVPSTAILACVLLALATLLSVPLMLAGVLRIAELQAERYTRFTMLSVALASLRATTVRSLALAATGAVALFGSVALGGARNDLLRGIAAYSSHYVGAADIWLVNPGDNQAINDFPPGQHIADLTRVPGVAGVRAFQGSFLDVGARRLWVIAWPPENAAELLDGQVIAGRLDRAVARVREGGWITVSERFASEHHLGVGGMLDLPTPTGDVAFRLAATTTNFGWSPGAILMSTSDYSRAWGTRAPTALGVNVSAGSNLETVLGAIERELGPGSGLEVLTARARAASIDASANEGLSQLGEIATLLLLAAIVAMVAALGSSIWQRRVSLAALRLEGTKPARLRRLLLIEVTLMLAAGCFTGALAGIYGEVVIDGYLRHVTGFPVASFGAGGRPLEIFLLVAASVLAVSSIPGWLASRVAPTLALEE